METNRNATASPTARSGGEPWGQVIARLRMPLTVGIVMIHFNIGAHPLSVGGTLFGGDAPRWFTALTYAVSETLPVMAVPLFFLFAGYLFFYGKQWDAQTYRRQLRKRARTLLIPYILWNLLTVAYHALCLIPVLAPFFPSAHLVRVQPTVAALFHTLADVTPADGLLAMPGEAATSLLHRDIYPADAPLWFVRDLMLLCLLSPAIWWLLRRMGGWMVMAAGIGWWVLRSVYMADGGYPSILLMGLFFFSWGALYAIRGQNLLAGLRPLRHLAWLWVPLAVADVLLSEALFSCGALGNMVHNLAIPCGMVAAVNVFSRSRERGTGSEKRLRAGERSGRMWWSEGSFFLYCMHAVVMGDIAKVAIRLLHLPDTPPMLVQLYFGVPLVTIGLCLALHALLKRHLPRVAALLTGGR